MKKLSESNQTSTNSEYGEANILEVQTEEITPPEDSTSTETPENEVINNPNLNIDELINTYLFGIELVDPKGNPFPKSLIVSYINSAVAYAESLFDIILTPTEVKGEYHDYERNDYLNWGYLQLWKKPVREITAMRLMYGTRPSFEIP